MKVNTISRNNNSNINLHKTNNNSKPVFKGENYARILEKFDFSLYSGDFSYDKVFYGIKDLFKLASKEAGFCVTNWDLYKKLKKPKTSEQFWNLFDKLHLSYLPDKKSNIIVKDSQGPLIKYNALKGLLEFLSNDQSVTIGVSHQQHGLFHTYETKNKKVLFD